MLPVILLAAALAPAPQEPAPAAVGSAETHIDAGLADFRKRRFPKAEIHFRQAMEADPSSAAAAWYLAYTYYKIAEPKRPFHPDKQKSKDMFAKAFAIDPAFRPVWGEARAAKK